MSKMNVADYLVKELKNLGITDVFGLPGDFNFNIIEAIEKNNETNWIGCTNELNAGYAADGYARVKGYGAIVTTYGVGELSAINAIAGCSAEFVPVIKIVGVPKTENIEKNTILHHNLAAPNYHAFERAYSNVVESTAFLNKDNAKSEIDRILSVLINKKKPVYLAIPDDICDLEIDEKANIKKEKSDPKTLENALNHIKELLKKAKTPVVLADILVERFEAKDELFRFLENSKYPASTLLMGKSVINWGYEGFMGTYLGKHGNREIYDYVNNSDCVITIGAIYSDLNTFGFDYSFNPSSFIDIEGNYVIVENIKYENVLMKDVLFELSKNIIPKTINYPKAPPFEIGEVEADEKLNSDFIYPRMQNFIEEDDIVFCETGIVEFGFAPIKLPKGANLYNQILWGSIGWATPASFGAAIAKKDKRVILMTGEGSHQLTAQEVSSMLRYSVKPIIIILNNSGYTIERMLCKNPMDNFNNIAAWDFSKLPLVFKGESWISQAKTNREFDIALKEAKKMQKEKLCYIEIFTDKMDVPKLAKMAIKKASSNIYTK